jgi:hypothetical protein
MRIIEAVKETRTPAGSRAQRRPKYWALARVKFVPAFKLALEFHPETMTMPRIRTGLSCNLAGLSRIIDNSAC